MMAKPLVSEDTLKKLEEYMTMGVILDLEKAVAYQEAVTRMLKFLRSETEAL